MHEIVFDTETTGLSHANGDRVIEIGCVELWNLIPTGKTFHVYINPQRYVSQSAVNVHGLTTKFLQDKPLFHQIAKKLLDFLQDSQLVAHNANFDVGFLNHELKTAGFPILSNNIIDTLKIAKQKFPRSPASLDALCKRFAIDIKDRSKHGALLDSGLLAKVYLELMGGAQTSIIQESKKNQNLQTSNKKKKFLQIKDEFLVIKPTEEQQEMHKKILQKIPNSFFILEIESNFFWQR